MSTEWVPLSIRTPPPLRRRSAFHRPAMSTGDLNAFATLTMSPSTPSWIMFRNLMISLT